MSHTRERDHMVRKIINTLFEDQDIVEVRSIQSWQQGGRRRTTVRSRDWLTAGELPDNLETFRQLNSGEHAANVYFGVCPRPQWGAGKSKDVKVCRALWADVDDARPKRAMRRVVRAGYRMPSIAVDSGHGTHLYWLLDEPFSVTGAESRRRIESILKGLQRAIGGDNTQDLARLLRLPGFMNVKDVRNGAEPTECVLVKLDVERRHALYDFPDGVQARTALPASAVENARRVPGVIGTILGRLEDVPVGERSEVDFGVCCDLVRLGLTHAEAWALVKGKSKFSERGKEYFDRTWKKANESIGASPAVSTIPPTLVPLGIDLGTQDTIVWIRDKRRLWRITRLSSLDTATLVQMAGQNALSKALNLSAVRNAIAESSRNRTFGPNDFIGQGIRRIPGTQGIFVLAGSKAARILTADGHLSVQHVGEPLIGNKLIEFDDGQSWGDLNAILHTARKTDRHFKRRLWSELLDYLSCWNFALQRDRELVAAMILATCIQGVLPFRPHVWITGATNTGKSALFDFLHGLWPFATKLENETSEAAIRQTVRRSCLPLLLDECEAWRGRRGVIKLLRSCTRGGKIAKGTPGGRPIVFGLEHIVWVASIDIGLQRAADRNRFVIVELEQPERISLPSRPTLRGTGEHLIAAALSAAEEICRTYARLVGSEAAREGGRTAECLALPAAVRTVFLEAGEAEAESYLQELVAERANVLAELAEPDHVDLLQDILSSPVRTKVLDAPNDLRISPGITYRAVPVGDLIGQHEHHEDLSAVGIGVLENAIFFAPKIIARRLLHGTTWEEVNIGSIRRRVPGAKSSRHRVAGANPRGILIPRDALCL